MNEKLRRETLILICKPEETIFTSFRNDIFAHETIDWHTVLLTIDDILHFIKMAQC
jgi:hypothetical protein